MWEKTGRIKVIFAFFMLCFLALSLRLFFIQIAGVEDARTVYSSQYSSELRGISSRGDILDRNGEPLVNREDAYIILIDKTKFNDRAENFMKLLDAERISVDNRRYIGFKTENYQDKIIDHIKSEYGGYVFTSTERYTFPQPAAHVIGYCNRSDNRGTFGLERAFDSLLASEGELNLAVDGAGRILPGYGLTYDEHKSPEDVKTTLDYDIQVMAEEILAGYAEKGGAVIIADADTGGILCSASFPSYDPDNIEKARGSSLINRAIQASYPPGSVFKIIVAAAAVEADIAEPDDIFHCSGSEDVFGVKIRCSKNEGHGDITFEEGFAKSCNCVFIQLGRKLGGERILEMAERFGLGEEILGILEEESPGLLPNRSQISGAGIGNLSIGQGETEITCIQAAQTAGVIACRGRNPGLYLTEGDENPEKGDKILSVRTALTLRKMMCKVVDEGTGIRAGADSAGKSGSAQSYLSGNKVVHGWYTGFFPAENPEYIVAVFTESSGGASDSVKVFGEIHEKLTEYNYNKEN